MAIIDTGAGQPLISQTARAPVRVERSNPRSESEPKVSTSAEVTTVPVTPSQVAFGRLQAVNEYSNREALRIRTEERNAARVDQLVAEMKDTLYHVIKNYPPYPLDNPERAKFLMSFNGLKREIEQMTIPPETTELPLVGGTATGISRPDLPSLGVQATNSEIQFAIQRIDQASETTTTQAAMPVTTGVSEEKIAVLATIAGPDFHLTVPNEAEAVATSTSARQEFSNALNGSLTGAQSQLLALAG